MTELENKIQQAAQLYYSKGKSELSDAEFDELVDQLKKENPNSELFNKPGWGYQPKSVPGTKFKHKYGCIGSLDKCRTYDEVDNDLKDVSIDASLKLDGISVVLYYENGDLVQALTRGDGYIGIDITDKIKFILDDINIPDKSFTGAVRGEIVMSHDNFEEFKRNNPEAKNPRNSTAGLVGMNNISSDLKYLDILVYRIVGCESDHDIKNTRQMSAWLSGNFKSTAPRTTIVLDDKDIVNQMNELCVDWGNKYPSDGVVLTDMMLDRSNLPEIKFNSQAFKFKSEVANAKVIDVEWIPSKTRYMIPKLKLLPVQLAGTIVQAATGYNAKYIKDHNIGKGAIVEVEKRGEIIPNVNRVIFSSKADLPTICPACETDLEWLGVHLHCPNVACQNMLIQDTLVWLNYLVPTDGLGDQLKLKFLKPFCNNDVSVENLMSNSNKLSSMFFIGGAQHHKFMSMLERLFSDEKVDLKTAICALNIPRFGEKNSEKLAKYPDTVKLLIELSKNDEIRQDMLIDLPKQVGEANAISIRENLYKFKRLDYIAQKIDFTKLESFDMIKVAVTGKLSVKRSDFEAELKSNGYALSDISKDTKFLITDNPDGNSSKNIKADKLGVVKISESDFRNKYFK